MSNRCILLSTDLMLASHFAGAAERAGSTVATASNEESLLRLLADRCAVFVVIDLTVPGLEIEQTVAKLRALDQPPTILAFGPHVQEERLENAEQAGCDRVLTRGQFHAQMEAILRED